MRGSRNRGESLRKRIHSVKHTYREQLRRWAQLPLETIRLRAGLAQRQLADLIGTTASAICRLEDADYEGHSLAMLNRIAAA